MKKFWKFWVSTQYLVRCKSDSYLVTSAYNTSKEAKHGITLPSGASYPLAECVIITPWNSVIHQGRENDLQKF